MTTPTKAAITAKFDLHNELLKQHQSTEKKEIPVAAARSAISKQVPVPAARKQGPAVAPKPTPRSITKKQPPCAAPRPARREITDTEVKAKAIATKVIAEPPKTSPKTAFKALAASIELQLGGTAPKQKKAAKVAKEVIVEKRDSGQGSSESNRSSPEVAGIALPHILTDKVTGEVTNAQTRRQARKDRGLAMIGGEIVKTEGYKTLLEKIDAEITVEQKELEAEEAELKVLHAQIKQIQEAVLEATEVVQRVQRAFISGLERMIESFSEKVAEGEKHSERANFLKKHHSGLEDLLKKEIAALKETFTNVEIEDLQAPLAKFQKVVQKIDSDLKSSFLGILGKTTPNSTMKLAEKLINPLSGKGGFIAAGEEALKDQATLARIKLLTASVELKKRKLELQDVA